MMNAGKMQVNGGAIGSIMQYSSTIVHRTRETVSAEGALDYEYWLLSLTLQTNVLLL